MDEGWGEWFDRETAGCSLADARLHKRLRALLERMGNAMGESIPLACQDWAVNVWMSSDSLGKDWWGWGWRGGLGGRRSRPERAPRQRAK